MNIYIYIYTYIIIYDSNNTITQPMVETCLPLRLVAPPIIATNTFLTNLRRIPCN